MTFLVFALIIAIVILIIIIVVLVQSRKHSDFLFNKEVLSLETELQWYRENKNTEHQYHEQLQLSRRQMQSFHVDNHVIAKYQALQMDRIPPIIHEMLCSSGVTGQYATVQQFLSLIYGNQFPPNFNYEHLTEGEVVAWVGAKYNPPEAVKQIIQSHDPQGAFYGQPNGYTTWTGSNSTNGFSP